MDSANSFPPEGDGGFSYARPNCLEPMSSGPRTGHVDSVSVLRGVDIAVDVRSFAAKRKITIPPPSTQFRIATQFSIPVARPCVQVHRATLSLSLAALRTFRKGQVPDEMKRRGNCPLLLIDEIDYVSFKPEAANLFFRLLSARYERPSAIATSNNPFSRWGEVFGDDTVAAAMIELLVYHANLLSIKGASHRLKDRDVGRRPTPSKTD